MDFSTSEITSKKVRGNNVDFSTIEITLKKARGNNVDFSTSKIMLKKVRGNNVDFSTIEIITKKVRGNNVDISTIEITSKKYVKMSWKFGEIWTSTYRRNIHVDSTWCACCTIDQPLVSETILFIYYSKVSRIAFALTLH